MSADSAGHLIPARFAAGAVIGGYRLERHLGRGGMASVFLAADVVLGRQVALKVLQAEVADRGFRQRFVREPRLAAAVDDPHIIPVYGAGEDDGVLYIAMRYVPGGDARVLLRGSGRLSPERAAAIVSPVALALDAAHGAGLVHRDVKPANILLDARPGRPDHVYLADFGVSKPASPSVTALTGTGRFVGTLGYVAPEQIRARALTGAADQYALACTAFELLTGQPPFESADPVALIAAHLLDPAPALSARDGRLAAADPVFARALAKDPAARYPTCSDFADDLRSALGLAPYIATDPQPEPEPVPDRGSAPDRGARPVPATRAELRARPRLAKRAGARARTPRPIPPRRTLVVALVAVVAIAAAGVRVLLEPSGQVSQARIAQSEAMAAQATSFSATNVPLAMLLSLQAFKTAPTPQAGTALAWASGQPLRRVLAVPPGARPIESVAFSPDGKILAAGDYTGRVRLWNTATGQRTATLNQGSQVGGVAFSPDGKILAAGDNRRVILWDTATRQRATVTVDLGSLVSSVAFSPDGKILAVGDNRRVILWDTATGQRTATLNTGSPVIAGNPVGSVVFSPDGKTLAVGDGSGHVILWDMATGQRATITVDLGDPVTSVAFSPDGKILAAAGDGSGHVILTNMATGQRTTVTLSHGGMATSVAFSPDSKILAIGNDYGRVILWNPATGERTTINLDQGGGATSVAFSPDGKILAAASVASTHVTSWNPTTSQLTATLTLPNRGTAVAFSRAGMLMTGDGQGDISIWNTSTGRLFATPAEGSPGPTSAYALSPDGQLIAAAGQAGGITLLRENLGDLSLGHFERLICGEVRGNLTRDEWARYAPGQPYQKTCPAYP